MLVIFIIINLFCIYKKIINLLILGLPKFFANNTCPSDLPDI